MTESPGDQHAFVRRPHRTLLALSFPVLVSLIAEPLTGLADTAFIARLGTTPLAGLGIGTAALSGIFWAFNFLGIGTQTEVAHADGTGARSRGRDASGLAMAIGALIGCGLAAIGFLGLEFAMNFMSDDAEIRSAAAIYLKIRLLGGPAILITMAAFGAMRGLQDMRTPLAIALAQNALNIALDAVLIFGAGPIPAFGIAGAAWASVVSQWLGALWAVDAVRRGLGLPSRIHWRDATNLLRVGRDLFFRTGTLILFIVLTTRAATLLGANEGAAHHVIRQFWILSALLLDAFGAAAQSLIGFFIGAGQLRHARRAAAVACLWGTGAGFALMIAMLASEGIVAAAFLPTEVHAMFGAAWFVYALAQPANALAFVTDGIHWGTSDYRFLRNAMIASTIAGLVALYGFAPAGSDALTTIWFITAIWIAIRTLFGMVRIWPGFGSSPLALSDEER
ncbi:MAG: MATE family efflux transporter [Deltaproteobacteria bacterium]|nr:MATE family efflux transporter [Deltaproteobacteria bacterium]